MHTLQKTHGFLPSVAACVRASVCAHFTLQLASIILEFSAPLPGEVYVGIVGRNFNAGDWDVDPSESKHAVVFSARYQ